MSDNKILCPICGIDFVKRGIDYRLTKTTREQGHINYGKDGKEESTVKGFYDNDKETEFFEPYCPNCNTILEISKDEAFGELVTPVEAIKINGNGNGNGEGEVNDERTV